jgi:cysteine desulfurase / selenocysteine lyase
MIYLDNAATSWPKAPTVAEAMASSVLEPIGNVGRSSHGPALAASGILYSCRSALLHFVPPTPLEQVIFTRNATEALNIALFGSLQAGDTVLTTPMEHNAVGRPIHQLFGRGVCVEVCPCDDFGRIDPGVFRSELRRTHPALTVFTAASNVTGTVNPVETMVSDCVAEGVPYIIDAAQSIGELPRWQFPSGGDGAVCFSLHKGLLGPAGVGAMVLYGGFRPRPLWFGGTGSLSDSVLQPDFLPDCYESGTPAIQSIAGCVAALEYCHAQESAIQEQRKTMGDLLYAGLTRISELRMLSPAFDRVPVVSVTMRVGTISSLSNALYAAGVAVRTGFHCAPLAHQRIGSTQGKGAVRFAPGFATTESEIIQTLAIVEEAMHG